MYIVKIKSKNSQGFECIDTYNLPTQIGITNLCKAYDLLGEKIIAFDCKYGE